MKIIIKNVYENNFKNILIYIKYIINTHINTKTNIKPNHIYIIDPNINDNQPQLNLLTQISCH